MCHVALLNSPFLPPSVTESNVVEVPPGGKTNSSFWSSSLSPPCRPGPKQRRDVGKETCCHEPLHRRVPGSKLLHFPDIKGGQPAVRFLCPPDCRYFELKLRREHSTGNSSLWEIPCKSAPATSATRRGAFRRKTAHLHSLGAVRARRVTGEASRAN